MSRARPAGFSLAQIVLHWTVVVLILFQFLAHDAMSEAWDAFTEGGSVPAADLTGANFHAIVGFVILVLALARLYLRFTRGVPALPADQPKAIRFLGNTTHFLLYALIIGLPIGGAAAWIGGIDAAGELHSAGTTLLLIVAGLHVLGALYEHFIAKTDVFRRMLKPQAR